ncbi:MAG: peptide MFS transporter [Schleiferiaceae bacterium]|jgi:POT family proton-dependent oligopeptide transporter|nr:peptide MFS transporter [Schleiferiaceae bacterium]MDR9441564.1 peptide MFS transporter [Schleiferiaceae bacterium]
MAQAQEIKRTELFGHPVGLYILFFTEMWERFSYYGMRAILTLYITSEVVGDNPGLGWDSNEALALYGWYTMLVYVMSIPGGILADKFIGQKRSVLVGGLILCAGHGILAVEQMWAFYLGLLLIVIGVGGLKPNISTMVGGLYKKGDIRRDKGFTIFYIGINIGAAAASLAVGYVGEEIGWHYGFGMAGVGMLLGQIVYMAGQKFLTGVGEPPSKEEKAQADDGLGQLFKKMLRETVPFALFGVVGLFGLYVLIAGVAGWALGSIGYGLLTIFLAFVTGLMAVIYNELGQKEKDRYVVLLLSFIIVIVFWGAFEQAGGLMNIYTKEKVDRFVDLGFLFQGTIPASVFQAVNAIFIIIFGTIVAGFWARRKRKGGEASSLFKMAIGTMIMGLGFLFMAKASMEVLGGTKAALVWIIMAYLFHTLGELSTSPVALSFITKLAPAKYTSILMGVFFAATGLGNKLAGVIGEFSQSEPIYAEVNSNFEGQGGFIPDSTLAQAGLFEVKGEAYLENGEVVLEPGEEGDGVIDDMVRLNQENRGQLRSVLQEQEATAANPQHVTVTFVNEKDSDALMRGKEVEVSMANYEGEVVLFEASNELEMRTFIMITVITVLFGIILLIFLRKLKKLTHGAEEEEGTAHEEQEGFELADKE